MILNRKPSTKNVPRYFYSKTLILSATFLISQGSIKNCHKTQFFLIVYMFQFFYRKTHVFCFTRVNDHKSFICTYAYLYLKRPYTPNNQDYKFFSYESYTSHIYLQLLSPIMVCQFEQKSSF